MKQRAWQVIRSALAGALLSTVLCCYSLSTAQDLEFGPPYVLTDAFLNPFGIGIDYSREHLIIADTGNHRLAWTDLAALPGSPAWTYFGYVADSTLPQALVDPQGVAVDSAGNVYVVDTRQNEVQLFIWDAGTSNYVYAPGFAAATPHEVDGTPIDVPRDIAIGPDDSVYLLDSGNNRILTASGPADTTWEVALSGTDWGNPYGITIGHDNKIYIADTDNHRILRHSGGITDTFGTFGTGPAQFRYPRDVAVDIDGRMYVVDCFNHRMEIINDSGAHVFTLGHAPMYSSVQKITIDAEDRIFIVDSDRNAVIAYLGEDVPVPFDLYIRDYVGDTGSQPSDPAYTLASPDILLRHDMDIDIDAALLSGLNTYAFEQARYGEDNYLYVAVHNKGTQSAEGGFLRLYWTDRASGLVFPDDFSNEGFFKDHTPADEGSTYMIPPVAPVDGVRIIGPILWHPPHPEDSSTAAGDFTLAARIVHPFDTPAPGNGVDSVRENNNVTLRNVKVIAPPFPTGEQNTLVISVHYPDIADTVDMGLVETKVDELRVWMEEVSYGEVQVNPIFRGPITLAHDSSYYASPTRNLLIEMAQEVLDQLLADDPEILNGVMPGTDDDIDRLLLITNDSAEIDWATTGYWPYNVDGEDRYLTVSVQNKDNSSHLFSHGYCHQLGMVDLYPHEFVTLPFPYADGWDSMAQPVNGVHPLVWSKNLATWISEHDSEILFIPRPERGGIYESPTPLELYHQSTAAEDENVGIAIGLSPGVTALEEETHFFYLEARDNTLGNFDSVAPGTGVLMYYVNAETPGGRGPVMIRDHGVSPGHDLTLAAIPPGDFESPEGTGIIASVASGPADGPDYLINLTYEPPVTDYDVYITRGDPAHISPDIWIQKQPYDYDETSIPADPEDRMDEAVGGQENRIWALVHNRGDGAEASNVDVLFHISEPYHTVGDIPDFEFFKNKIIPSIPAGESRAVYVTWTPEVEEPHSCVWVDLQNLFDDNNAENNDAQQNLSTDWSTHSSPYSTIIFPFQIKNGESEPQLMYFRSDGVPKGWAKSFAPPKVYLGPGETAFAQISVTPPEEAPDCTSYDTQITAWTPRGDTLVKVGGTSLVMNLGKALNVDFEAKVIPCEGEVLKETIRECCEEYYRYCKENPEACREDKGECGPSQCPCVMIDVRGCTNPPLKNEEIEIRYRDEDGNPVYHFVITDEYGCFHDYMVATEPGEWEVDVSAGGEDCIAPGDAGTTVVVSIPGDDDQNDPSYNNPALLIPFDRAFWGQLRMRDSFDQKCRSKQGVSCKAEKARYSLDLELPAKNRCDATPWRGQRATLHTENLLAVFSESVEKRGYHTAEATIKTQDNTIIRGSMNGFINTNAHRFEGDTAKKQCELPAQFDGRFDGMVVEDEKGRNIGTRVIFDYSFMTTSRPPFAKTQVKGRLTGVAEKGCEASHPEARFDFSEELVKKTECVIPISKYGNGTMHLKGEQEVKCQETVKDIYTTKHQFHTSLKSTKRCDKDLQSALNGDLFVENLVHTYEAGFFSRARHGGEFIIKSSSGEIIASGVLSGFTHTNSHSGEKCVFKRHMQGQMAGTIVNGPLKGNEFRAIYTAFLKETDSREVVTLSFILEGASFTSCDRFHPLPLKPTGQVPDLQSRQDSEHAIGKGDSEKSVHTLTEHQQGKLRELHAKTIEKHFGRIEALSAQDFNIADRDEDKHVSEEEFIRFRVAQKSFNHMDTDEDFLVSLDELLHYQVSRVVDYYFARFKNVSEGKSLDLEDIVKTFPFIVNTDTDNDNIITRDELSDWLKIELSGRFRENDYSKDGFIDISEYLRSLPEMQIKTQ